MSRLGSFSLREVLLLTAVVALVIVLWLTAANVPPRSLPGSIPPDAADTVRGPILVSYRERTDPNSTSGADDVRMEALHFVDGGVVFEYAGGEFRLIESSRLELLRWRVAD